MNQFMSKSDVIRTVKEQMIKKEPPKSKLYARCEQQRKKLIEIQDVIGKKNTAMKMKREQYQILFDYVVSRSKQGDEEAKEALREVAAVPQSYKGFDIFEEVKSDY